jgi:acetyl esterase/lipase
MMLPSCVLLALAAQPVVLPLWPEGVPGAPAQSLQEVVWGEAPDRRVRDVHSPNITVHRPAAQDHSGAAVVICPGGGYGLLAFDKEGHEIARWFAEQGVTGVVLKYRLPRPKDHVYGHTAPLADAARALELVRENAEAWGVDKNRVGIMGFSAGGHLAATASTLLPDTSGPDFTVLIYPVITFREGVGHMGSRRNLLGENGGAGPLLTRFCCDENVSVDTPAAFLVHTGDDGVKVENSLRYYAACRAAGVPAALHLFERGGHGYAMRAKGTPVGEWPALLLTWMGGRGLLAGR